MVVVYWFSRLRVEVYIICEVELLVICKNCRCVWLMVLTVVVLMCCGQGSLAVERRARGYVRCVVVVMRIRIWGAHASSELNAKKTHTLCAVTVYTHTRSHALSIMHAHTRARNARIARAHTKYTHTHTRRRTGMTRARADTHTHARTLGETATAAAAAANDDGGERRRRPRRQRRRRRNRVCVFGARVRLNEWEGAGRKRLQQRPGQVVWRRDRSVGPCSYSCDICIYVFISTYIYIVFHGRSTARL